jgi:hypothetical protein
MAVGQYPRLLPDVLTIEHGAVTDAVPVAVLMAFAGAALLAVLSLIRLYTLTDTGTLDTARPIRSDSSEALLQALAAARKETGDDDRYICTWGGHQASPVLRRLV